MALLLLLKRARSVVTLLLANDRVDPSMANQRGFTAPWVPFRGTPRW